jgi:hypothetical protein
MFEKGKIEKVEKISTDAFGNSKYKITERTGWFSTKTYEVTEKSNSDTASAGLLLIGITLLFAIFALAVLPYIMVLIANSPGSVLKQTKYRWISFFSLVVIASSAGYILFDPELYGNFFGITENSWILSIMLGLNATATISLILAQLPFITNRANQFFCIIGGVASILLMLQIFLSKSIVFASFKYNQKQMEAACDCYHNSWNYNHKKFDFMTAREQKMRKDCFDLFKPDDYKLGDDVDVFMKEACDLNAK